MRKWITACTDCGWKMPEDGLRSMALDDDDPTFTTEEKMFQILNWLLETNGDGEAHNCKVTFMGVKLFD